MSTFALKNKKLTSQECPEANLLTSGEDLFSNKLSPTHL